MYFFLVYVPLKTANTWLWRHPDIFKLLSAAWIEVWRSELWEVSWLVNSTSSVRTCKLRFSGFAKVFHAVLFLNIYPPRPLPFPHTLLHVCQLSDRLRLFQEEPLISCGWRPESFHQQNNIRSFTSAAHVFLICYFSFFFPHSLHPLITPQDTGKNTLKNKKNKKSSLNHHQLIAVSLHKVWCVLKESREQCCVRDWQWDGSASRKCGLAELKGNKSQLEQCSAITFKTIRSNKTEQLLQGSIFRCSCLTGLQLFPPYSNNPSHQIKGID